MKTILALCAALAMTLAAIPARAHWPGQPEHQFAQLGDLKLESGEVIPNFRMSYVTHGKLNAARDNAILFQHGFAANHHLFDHMIGSGRPLDTDKYFIVCPDALGATQTTFEHTTSPSNSGLAMKFPFYKDRDMVNAQYRLLTEALGITHLVAVTGVSSGGEDSIQFAVSYPRFMDAIIPVVGGALWSKNGRLRTESVLSMLDSCKGWDGGHYSENPQHCATHAMQIWAQYFYTPEWWNVYADTAEAYTRWRETIGAYYIDVQDARDVYYRIRAFYGGWIGDTPGFGDDLGKALGSIRAKTLFIYNPQDQFSQPSHVEAQLKMIPGARAVAIDSIAGHFIAANADPQATRAMEDAIRGFLRDLEAQRTVGK